MSGESDLNLSLSNNSQGRKYPFYGAASRRGQPEVASVLRAEDIFEPLGSAAVTGFVDPETGAIIQPASN